MIGQQGVEEGFPKATRRMDGNGDTAAESLYTLPCLPLPSPALSSPVLINAVNAVEVAQAVHGVVLAGPGVAAISCRGKKGRGGPARKGEACGVKARHWTATFSPLSSSLSASLYLPS